MGWYSHTMLATQHIQIMINFVPIWNKDALQKGPNITNYIQKHSYSSIYIYLKCYKPKTGNRQTLIHNLKKGSPTKLC